MTLIEEICLYCGVTTSLIGHSTLGGRDSDKINCPQCNKVLKEWWNDTTYYTIMEPTKINSK